MNVVWDWNGTLLDDVEQALNAVNILMHRRNLAPMSLEHYREIFDFPVREFYRKAGFCLEKENWDSLVSEYHAALAQYSSHKKPQLFADAKEVLAKISAKGGTQYILSSSPRSILTRQMKELGVESFFEKVAAIENFDGASKLELASALGLKDAVLFGDALHDAEIARKMNWQCVLLSTGHQSRRKLECAGFRVACSLRDAVAFL